MTAHDTLSVPQRVHGFAARLPTTNSYILPFVHSVQELHIYPLVHGLGITKISKILCTQRKTTCYLSLKGSESYVLPTCILQFHGFTYTVGG